MCLATTESLGDLSQLNIVKASLTYIVAVAVCPSLSPDYVASSSL